MSYSSPIQGKFTPKNPQKYVGNVKDIVFRSSWELQTFRYLDMNSDVEKWSSEGVVIPYICKTDKKEHRYFVDLYIKFVSGKEFLIEIKPKSHARPPKMTSRNKAALLESVLMWSKNESKWEAAGKYAKARGMTFLVWTEDTLKSLGIQISTGKIR